MKKERILFVDAARTYAIILALGAHAVGTFGVPDAGPLSENYMFVTTLATPMFIFMFGVMMELVYTKKAEASPMSVVDRRLYRRSYQCYVAFLLTALSALVVGKYGIDGFVLAALMVKPSYHGNILIVYTVSLLIMPAVLRARISFGVRGLLGIMAILTPLVALASFTAHYDFGSWGFVADNLLGIGTAPNGPSVPLGMLFILSGMITGHYARKGSRFYNFAATAAAGILILISLITGADTIEEIKEVISLYGYGAYRSQDSILYFLLGTFYSLAAFCGIRWVVDRAPLTHGLVRSIAPLGMNSLLAFTFGNIMLNLWHPIGKDFLPPSVAIMVFFLTVWTVCRYTEYMPGYTLVSKVFDPSFTGASTNTAAPGSER